MKLKYFLFGVILLAACNSRNADTKAKKEFEVKIAQAEERLYKEKDRPADFSAANNVLNLYLDFSRAYPTDEKSPEYTFKAAELANSIHNPELAITLFETVRKKYPTYDKAPYALFLQAFIYENSLKNYDKARELYTQVIKEYPSHDVAAQSKMILPNVGKSDEELIREFEEKNKKESQDKE